MKIPLTVNEQQIIVEADCDEPLLTVLRRNKIISVKKGCTEGRCGVCTVLLNNKPVPSCILAVAAVRTDSIITLEYFSKKNPLYTDILTGFEQAGIHLCGYCNAGKIFAAYDIISSNRALTREIIRKETAHLICQCTDQDTLINGILLAANAQIKRNGRNTNG